MRMRSPRLTGLCLIVLIVGCVPARVCPPPLLRTRELLDVDTPPGLYKPCDPQEFLHIPTMARPAPVPGGPPPPLLNVLVLSGGGVRGAYTAGVLKGWSASGTRPCFDVVTGISTGALIAPMAFLGPQYDDMLERSYTTLRNGDIYRKRPWLALLYSDSLADPTPLKHRIDQQITEEMIDQIARAHGEGRRLYVGTTNLDTRRLVVWDMGAIASSKRPGRVDLFRQLLLASCSIPGVFPPAAVDLEVNGKKCTELHVDGGVSSSVFLEPFMLRPAGPAPMESNVYVVLAGKLHSDPQCVKPRLAKVSAESLQALLLTRGEGDLLRTYLVAHFNGGRYHLASVPQDFPLNSNRLAFDPKEMRQLFDAGYQFALSGRPWRNTPPGVEPEEQRLPRSGVYFVVPEAGDAPAPLPEKP